MYPSGADLATASRPMLLPGAAAIVDDDRSASARRSSRREHACHGVAHAARRVGHDEADRLGGIRILRDAAGRRPRGARPGTRGGSSHGLHHRGTRLLARPQEGTAGSPRSCRAKATSMSRRSSSASAGNGARTTVLRQHALLHEHVLHAHAIVAKRCAPADARERCQLVPDLVRLGGAPGGGVPLHARRAPPSRVAAKPISAPSQPISIASRMNVSLPVSTPIRRGAAAASSMLASVLSTLNDASLIATTPGRSSTTR